MVTTGRVRQQGEIAPALAMGRPVGGSAAGRGGDVLASWAEGLAGRAGKPGRRCLRFAFYGRVSTEDWQDPVTSRARQLQPGLCLALAAGAGNPLMRGRSRPSDCRSR